MDLKEIGRQLMGNLQRGLKDPNRKYLEEVHLKTSILQAYGFSDEVVAVVESVSISAAQQLPHSVPEVIEMMTGYLKGGQSIQEAISSLAKDMDIDPSSLVKSGLG